jgi:hypothetical protein
MNKHERIIGESYFEGCQLPCINQIGLYEAKDPLRSFKISLKRTLAYPWNYYIKQWLKNKYYSSIRSKGETSQQVALKAFLHVSPLKEGDKVRVRSLQEIKSTLDPFNELKGCAFLLQMHQYCGTTQRVFKIMQRFLDERDYKVKKTRGLVLLENNFCNGTPVFGICDRSCFLFWREEWLEKIE